MLGTDTPTGVPVVARDAVVLSLPEINALSLRAARGAGYEWGLAEELGVAAVWLAERGFTWADIILDRLAGDHGADPRPATVRWHSAGPVCGLRAGAALADFAALPEGVGVQGVEIGAVLTPQLLLPFAAQAARVINCPCEISQNDTLWAYVTADSVLVVSPATGHTQTATLSVRRTDRRPDRGQTAAPTTCISRTTYAQLDRFARRMTVPATALSQARAGGDTPDTD